MERDALSRPIVVCSRDLLVTDAWGDNGQRISTDDLRCKAGRLIAFLSEQWLFAFPQPASSEWITPYDQTILVAKGETTRAAYRRILRQIASFAASLPGMDHEFVPARLTSTVEERYGKAGAETILSNASTHLVLPGVGQREAEFYARRIGNTTITALSRSRRGAWEVSSHHGESTRRLIEPNGIRMLPER